MSSQNKAHLGEIKAHKALSAGKIKQDKKLKHNKTPLAMTPALSYIYTVDSNLFFKVAIGPFATRWH